MEILVPNSVFKIVGDFSTIFQKINTNGQENTEEISENGDKNTNGNNYFQQRQLVKDFKDWLTKTLSEFSFEKEVLNNKSDDNSGNNDKPEKTEENSDEKDKPDKTSEVKDKQEKTKLQVSWVDVDRASNSITIRLNYPDSAKPTLKYLSSITKKSDDQEDVFYYKEVQFNGHVLTGDEEINHWKEIARSKKGTFGGKRKNNPGGRFKGNGGPAKKSFKVDKRS